MPWLNEAQLITMYIQDKWRAIKGLVVYGEWMLYTAIKTRSMLQGAWRTKPSRGQIILKLPCEISRPLWGIAGKVFNAWIPPASDTWVNWGWLLKINTILDTSGCAPKRHFNGYLSCEGTVSLH